jgi:hypothetical protein
MNIEDLFQLVKKKKEEEDLFQEMDISGDMRVDCFVISTIHRERI